MTIAIELIPGVKNDAKRSYVYVQCPDPVAFRKFFEKIKIDPGISPPKSGSLMNKEVQLETNAGSYFAISMTGDREAWRRVIEAYCNTRGINFANIEERELLVSDGIRIPLDHCKAISLHGSY